MASLLAVMRPPAALAWPGPVPATAPAMRDSHLVVVRGFGWGGRHRAHRERGNRSSDPGRKTDKR
ncbi:hypothetical protein [Methylobacterium sp. SyP6R]|uniref:hypothetical protein n=1 Tax=Methylobacterium sp. SyP6R TaxID=2718876 RepID=UPI001F357113|nr:hypothetical protein [Methylobacterium sp. SyP6R]MCF4129874.1 hypothetical protein [Methylobacterium sp. SyP6R]